MCKSTVSLTFTENTCVKVVNGSLPENLLKRLISNPHPHIVRVLEYHQTGPEQYLYTMEKLLPLTQEDDEYFYIHWGIDDMFYEEDKEDERRFTREQEKEIWSKVSYLRQSPKVQEFFASLDSFWETIRNRYYDLHPSNVMKDAQGNYKLIDLEGFGL